MKGVNKAILLGNLGQDPETRYVQSGKAITTVSLATSESWTDKASGEKKEQTEWHRIVFFDRLAEIAGEYLQKGMSIYVEGKIQTRKWEDDAGTTRYTTEIVGREMQMLGRKPEQEQKPAGFREDGTSLNWDERFGKYGPPPPMDAPKAKAPVQKELAPEPDYVDDDIPF